MARAAKKKGTPAAAVIAGGVRGTKEEPVTSIATRNVGDVVELVERANYTGTMAPQYLDAGTIAKVSAHCGDPVERVLITVETPAAPSRVYYIPPSTTVRVRKAYEPVMAGRAANANDVVDPLLARMNGDSDTLLR